MYADVCGIHVCPEGVSILYDVAVVIHFQIQAFHFQRRDGKDRKR